MLPEAITGLLNFFFNGFGQVDAPSIGHVAFVNLVLDGIVDGSRDVDDVDFRFDVFEELQRIFQGVTAFDEFIGRNTEGNRNPRSDCFANSFDDEAGKAGTVFIGTAEFIGTFIIQGR